MKIELDVKKVTVLINVPGTDEVDITLNGPSPFPGRDMDYDAHATVNVRKGYGVEWCKKVLGVEPGVIDARNPHKTNL